MSFAKIEGPPKVVRFYYLVDDIFNAVSNRSANRALEVKDQSGNPDFNRTEISIDKKDIIKEFMEEGLIDIFANALFNLMESDTVKHDVDYTPTGGTQDKYSYGDITDHERYRNINLDLIDKKIKNGLINFILWKWYDLKAMGEDAKMRLAEYNLYVKTIAEKSVALRTR